MRILPRTRPRLALMVVGVTLAGCASAPGPIVQSFGDFKPPPGTAHYLACPVNYCVRPVDAETPILPLNADKMRAVVRKVIDAQPRTTLIESQNEGLKLRYQQRSSVFGFTDTVTIDIVDVSEDESGIAIYSQSDAGSQDFGANHKRVDDWFVAIEIAVREATTKQPG
ncbi:MAG TPA: DUF1499 domain-containing protein [Stellaceae bacterium]|nr:DUF1499 domain-containing protein [Stellaceae bacterium]